MRTLRQLWVVAVILAGMFGARPALGPELIPNADFSAGAANWTANGPVVFQNGEAAFNGPVNGPVNLFSSAESKPGKTYLLQIDITASNGTIFYYNDDGVWIPFVDFSAGLHQVEVAFVGAVKFGFRASGNFVGSVTLFSAREKLT